MNKKIMVLFKISKFDLMDIHVEFSIQLRIHTLFKHFWNIHQGWSDIKIRKKISTNSIIGYIHQPQSSIIKNWQTSSQKNKNKQKNPTPTKPTTYLEVKRYSSKVTSGLKTSKGNIKLATNENVSVIELQCLSSKPTFYPLLCCTEFSKSINHFLFWQQFPDGLRQCGAVEKGCRLEKRGLPLSSLLSSPH